MLSLIKKSAFTALAFLYFCAEGVSGERSLTFESRFFLNSYSNEAIGQFGIEIFHLSSFMADIVFEPSTAPTDGPRFLIHNSEQWRNIGNAIILLSISRLIYDQVITSYHEHGHGTRLAAVGIKPFYYHSSRPEKTYNNFFTLLWADLLRRGKGRTTSWVAETLFSPLSSELGNYCEAQMRMGGINNEMFFAELIEDASQRSDSHIGFLLPYVYGKLAAYTYNFKELPSNDKYRIIRYYDDRDMSISQRQIDTSGWISLFSSAMTYHFGYQLVNILLGKSTYFKPLVKAGFELPNTSSYLSRDGLSYKVRSAYHRDNWRFPLALEYLTLGNHRVEATFGAEKSFGNSAVFFEIIAGRRLELSLEINHRIAKWLDIKAGYGLYDVRNLHGERHISSLEGGKTNNEFYLSTSLVY